jgi:hypothetical protein
VFRRRYSDARSKRLSTVQRDTIQKLRALTQESESLSALHNQNTATPRRRLLNLSEEIASLVKDLARDFCNCRFSTEVSLGKIEDFEAEMEIQCPIHGPCRLGTLVVVSVHGFGPNKSRIEQLIQEYDRRCQLWKDGGRQ